MTRYTLFVLAVNGSAAPAVASIAPSDRTGINPNNVTIIEKNMAFPVFGELEVDECLVEDCSDE